MQQKKNRKTPLGDKFDDVDFPIEPQAWSEMETLLATQTPKAPLSNLGKFGFFIVGIPLVLITFWKLSSGFKNTEKQELTSTQTVILPIKNTITINDNTIELNKIMSKEKELNVNEADNKTTFKSSLSSVINYEELLNFSKTTVKEKPLMLNTKTVLIDNQNTLIGNENTLIKSDLNANSVGKSSFFKINKTELTNKNIELVNANNNAQKALNQPVVSVNNAAINSINSDNKILITPNSFVDNYLKTITKNTLDTNYATLKLNPFNTVINPNVADTKPSPIASESIDNQSIKTTENRVETSELTFLELRELSAIYSEKPQQVNNLEQLNAFVPTSLIPISQLWRGKHHQFAIGLGHASLSFNNNERAAINRFRLAYNYRVTPLLGLGLSTNYVLIKPNGYFSNTELELNMFFVSNKRFDMFLSAGYGYRRWDFKNNASETAQGQGKGFTLGLNAQYALNPHYSVGLRLDLKQVAEPDFGLLLVFSKSF